MSRMKVSVWKDVETSHYQTRNMPVRTLDRMTAVRGMLGRAASTEMVYAMALEYGLNEIERVYVCGGLSTEEAKRVFLRDFQGMFWAEEEG